MGPRTTGFKPAHTCISHPRLHGPGVFPEAQSFLGRSQQLSIGAVQSSPGSTAKGTIPVVRICVWRKIESAGVGWFPAEPRGQTLPQAQLKAELHTQLWPVCSSWWREAHLGSLKERGGAREGQAPPTCTPPPGVPRTHPDAEHLHLS